MNSFIIFLALCQCMTMKNQHKAKGQIFKKYSGAELKGFRISSKIKIM